jgi:putative flippase GtrA
VRERLRQLCGYVLVGVSCLALALSVLAGLHGLLNVNYLIAYCVSFVVSNLAGYLLNARFTFSASSNAGGAARYMAVNASLLGLNAAAMKLLVQLLGMWYIGAAILLAVINAPISFVAQRLITYRLHPGRSTAPL